MKKLTYVLFALAALLILAVPACAAGALPDRGDPPAAVSHASSAAADEAGPTPTPAEEPVEPVDGSGDVAVDESTYREEPSAPYEPVQRFPGRGEIDDILSYWEENGYPPCVSYAFEAGGEVMDDGTVCAWWEIGLVDADETRKEAILKLVSPTCLVEFKNCLFTHAQKQTAYDIITELAVNDPNILEVIFIRNDDTVWVAVPEELTKEYARYLIRDLRLGAVVSVTDQRSLASFEGGLEIGITTPGIGLDTAGAPIPAPDAPGGESMVITGGESGLVHTVPQTVPSPVFWMYLALAVAAACALTALALRRRFAPAAVTASGEIRTPGAPLTRAQAEQAVKDGQETPDSGIYRAILDEANNQKE